MPQKKIKIALLGDTLAHGGAERVHSTLSIYLDQMGFDVHNIINLDAISYPYGGKMYNLGIYKSASSSLPNKWKRYQLFRNYIRTHAFDYIIDFRTRSKPLTEMLLHYLVFNTAYIPTVHSSELSWYFTTRLFWGQRLYRKAKEVICVSQAITDQVRATYGYTNVRTIYNPISLHRIQEQANEPNPFQGTSYIVACGRMDSDLKQFDRLIDIYSESQLPNLGIRLLILGEGEQKKHLHHQVETLGLEDWISLPGFVENPFPIFKAALFFIHSSRLEGFPTVLLEAFACGIPVVTFDCPTGPREIIKSEYNGLLIENQNFKALKEGMELLATSSEQRSKLKLNAQQTAQQYDMEVIGKIWLSVLCRSN
ncbi:MULTISPECIES: glycosyltransferase [unclassified Myroides]|uniref:glycosyltransferase n=1 Tax=unclassified Myroides TaxID=2642485 RepID=UPI003D2F5676